MNLGMSLLTGAMALALSVPAAAQTTELAPGMTASATAGVNLRAGPGSRHKRLTVIPEGAAVVIEECVPSWCEVTYDGINGFVYDTYLAAEWILQTTAVHRLRAGPGMEHAAVAEIPEGAAIAVEKCMPGWCEVTYDGMSGFIEIVAATPEETRVTLSRPAAEAVVLPMRGLVVRAGPGTGHKRVAAIPQGASIEIEECTEKWCEVAYGDTTGYVWKSYLGAEGAPATPPARAIGDLNLRAGAGMRHAPIAVIPAGATVEIGDCMPNRVWCEVTYGEKTGYASKRYLDFAS
jgi:uncharacterized protein YraI